MKREFTFQVTLTGHFDYGITTLTFSKRNHFKVKPFQKEKFKFQKKLSCYTVTTMISRKPQKRGLSLKNGRLSVA